MRPTHRINLLYGVICVLTTCLLLVGGAYRMQSVTVYRLQRENARLRTELKYEASEHLRLEAERENLMSIAEPVQIRSRGRIITSNVRVIRCNTGESSDALKYYIRAMENRLKTYEEAYPEPPAVRATHEYAIQREQNSLRGVSALGFPGAIERMTGNETDQYPEDAPPGH